MTTADLLFAIISGIALAAIGLGFYLLRQRGQLLSIVARQKRLRRRAMRQRNEAAAHREDIHLMRLREAALIRHGNQLIEERNLLRAQLVAYTEPSRFGVVKVGSA